MNQLNNSSATPIVLIQPITLVKPVTPSIQIVQDKSNIQVTPTIDSEISIVQTKPPNVLDKANDKVTPPNNLDDQFIAEIHPDIRHIK